MKDLVNAIIDRVLDVDALVAEVGAEIEKGRLQDGLRKVAELKIPDAQKKKLFRNAFRRLVLAESVRAAPRALVLARTSLAAEIRAVQAVGAKNLKTLGPLRKPELMARRSERAGTVGVANAG